MDEPGAVDQCHLRPRARRVRPVAQAAKGAAVHVQRREPAGTDQALGAGRLRGGDRRGPQAVPGARVAGTSVGHHVHVGQAHQDVIAAPHPAPAGTRGQTPGPAQPVGRLGPASRPGQSVGDQPGRCGVSEAYNTTCAIGGKDPGQFFIFLK